jgi:hypothetical protein
VEMVVALVVVSPTVIALFLDVSPDGPDVFPRVLVLSGFAFRSSCLSIAVLPAFGLRSLARCQQVGIWRIHFCLLSRDNLSFPGIDHLS